MTKSIFKFVLNSTYNRRMILFAIKNGQKNIFVVISIIMMIIIDMTIATNISDWAKTTDDHQQLSQRGCWWECGCVWKLTYSTKRSTDFRSQNKISPGHFRFKTFQTNVFKTAGVQFSICSNWFTCGELWCLVQWTFTIVIMGTKPKLYELYIVMSLETSLAQHSELQKNAHKMLKPFMCKILQKECRGKKASCERNVCRILFTVFGLYRYDNFICHHYCNVSITTSLWICQKQEERKIKRNPSIKTQNVVDLFVTNTSMVLSM